MKKQVVTLLAAMLVVAATIGPSASVLAQGGHGVGFHAKKGLVLSKTKGPGLKIEMSATGFQAGKKVTSSGSRRRASG